MYITYHFLGCLNPSLINVEDATVDDESSVWDDWDENCHGPMDRKGNRRTMPEGFIHEECCGGALGSIGCETGKHVERSGKRVNY